MLADQRRRPVVGRSLPAEREREGGQLEIRDRGAGVPPGLSGEIGKAFVTTKAEGMGLGLYIARTTLGRLGGNVELHNRSDGRGAVATIDLPLARLSA